MKRNRIFKGVVGPVINGLELGPDIIGKPLYYALRKPVKNKPETFEVTHVDVKRGAITLGKCKNERS